MVTKKKAYHIQDLLVDTFQWTYTKTLAKMVYQYIDQKTVGKQNWD